MQYDVPPLRRRTVAAPPVVPLPVPRPAPRSLQLVVGVIAPLGPLTMGASLLLSPYGNSGDATVIFDSIAAQPETAIILGWMGLIVGLTLIPGVIATGWAAPASCTAAGDRSLAGRRSRMVGRPAFPKSRTAGLSPPHGRHRPRHRRHHPHRAGRVQLTRPRGHGVDLRRRPHRWHRPPRTGPVPSPRRPPPLAILLVLAQPLHFVAFVVLQNTALDVTASWLTALGFGAAGWTLIRHRQ